MVHSRRLESLWFYECPDLDRVLSRPKFVPEAEVVAAPLIRFQELQKACAILVRWLNLRFTGKPTDTVGNFKEEMRVSLLGDVMKPRNLQIVDIVDDRQGAVGTIGVRRILNFDVGKLEFLKVSDWGH